MSLTQLPPPSSSGGVSSVFGRTGAVVATTGDYSVAQVTGAAPAVSPAFTGTPTAPTAQPGTNSTQVATVAFANSTGGVVGSIRNGNMLVTAASSTATFTANEVIVETALGGASFRLANYSQGINLATTGAGGMDTGSAPVSGYVALYAIYNPTTSTASILATNSTASVVGEVYGGANMPSGYTMSALLSVWPTNASSQFVVGHQQDRTISTLLVQVLSTTTTVGTWTSFSLSAAIPPNAKKVVGIINLSAASASLLGCFTAASSTGIDEFLNQTQATGSTIVQFLGAFDTILITTQTMYYQFNAAGATSPSLTIYVSKYNF